MTVRERILAAMFWEEPDEVPLTVYEIIMKRGETARLLRDRGVGLIYRLPAHRLEHREVEIVQKEYWEKGRRLLRRTFKTPVGEIWQTLEPDEVAYDTNTWIKDHFIKRPEDYRIMEFVVRDARYHDNFEALNQSIRRIGDDGLVYVRIAKSPIQEILYQMAGVERFSYDSYDCPERIDSLHEAMLTRYEELFELAAGSPVEIVLLGDNITGDIVGKERFRKYLLPVYSRAKHWLEGTGKRLASHMDGRLASLKEVIREADVDIIEALTPPPMGDLSVAEARRLWPDKALWLNFTSSMIIASPAAIEEHTRELLEQAGSRRGFGISITEDAPEEPMHRCLDTVLRVLKEYR
ncbi:MAG TPA: uroporphyrinogen decarboxylase family protein [Spirochaetia bacterium]|nr:uroporphyrinogen decarboxylase family protein [Spirochaetia bacterium]